MIDQELCSLVLQIQKRQCEEQTVEVKSAHEGCPQRLYDTISAFSNQDEGGTLVFGLDENQTYKIVGVYDAQDIQKKIMEFGEQMTPVVRPVLTVWNADGLNVVSAEIPPLDPADRPCFKSAKGRIQGSYIRVGDADKPMTEYEVYSYEAFRKKIRDDIRPVEGVTVKDLNRDALADYLHRRKMNRPNLSALPKERVYDLTGVTQQGQVTLAAVLLFSPYPQAYFPQLGVIASRVPGKEMGTLDAQGQRFTDSKRLEGTLTEMLDASLAFVQSNMRVSTIIDPGTGKRTDIPEYPLDAVREAVLNALIHRDYSEHTQDKPIQLIMYADRMEIQNPGGLYGRMTIDQLGHTQPETRNPFLVTAMEFLGKTENRYSGIPRIRIAMKEMGLPDPIFSNRHGTFSITLCNASGVKPQDTIEEHRVTPSDTKGLLTFCGDWKTRKEIITYLGLASGQYALSRYLYPLVKSGAIELFIPNMPGSSKQKYRTVQ